MTPLLTKQQSDSYSSPFSATIKQHRTGLTSLNTASSCTTTKRLILKRKNPRQKTNQALTQEENSINTYFAPMQSMVQINGTLSSPSAAMTGWQKYGPNLKVSCVMIKVRQTLHYMW